MRIISAASFPLFKASCSGFTRSSANDKSYGIRLYPLCNFISPNVASFNESGPKISTVQFIADVAYTATACCGTTASNHLLQLPPQSLRQLIGPIVKTTTLSFRLAMYSRRGSRSSIQILRPCVPITKSSSLSCTTKS